VGLSTADCRGQCQVKGKETHQLQKNTNPFNNPPNDTSDQHQFSLDSINLSSTAKVMRITKMITKGSLGSLRKHTFLLALRR